MYHFQLAPWQQRQRHGQVRRRWLAVLLSAPAVTMLGCGSLGGLSGSAPWGQHAAPMSAAALATQAPGVSSPGNRVPLAVPTSPVHYDDSTRGSTAPNAATGLTASVVPVAYEAPIYGDAAHDSRGLSDADVLLDPSCETGQGCVAARQTVDCGCGAHDAAEGVSSDGYRNAQEYIFDGGDQQPAVVIKKDWSAAGVDPTDTVVYYETLAGSVCVQPSNRVPIYAPRFGSVRQVSGLQLAMRAQGTERVLAPVAVERFDENNLAGTVVQPLAPQGEQQVGLIDAFQENYATPPMEQVQPLYRMSAARVPFELIDPTRTGQITIKELVDIRQFIQNAQAWVNPESLVVEIANQEARQVKDTQAAEDYYVYELPDKCAMRIFKAASHTIANSGDIVSFSIRFDNAGVKPLGNAVIIDSLSSRLDYIEGSQQCSVGVRFSAEPNDVGSMVLRWEIEEPIEPSDGGVISFDCQVR